MREIKIRAWDEEKNSMLSSIDLSGALHTYGWLGRSDLPLMEYTGLKDKNEVEIYEGDIVKIDSIYDNELNPYAEIIMIDGCWSLKVKRSQWFPNLYDYGYKLSVEGNIYETPELLR